MRKSDARVEAYGEVDELNAALGVVRAGVEDPEIDGHLARAQDELFCVGAELATPHEAKARSAIPPVDARWVERLEAAIDALGEELPPLTALRAAGRDAHRRRAAPRALRLPPRGAAGGRLAAEVEVAPSRSLT